MLSRFIAPCVLAASLAFSATHQAANAQLVDRVVAVVNDEAISFRDLDARLRLALVSSNIPDTQDARQRILPQVLRKMIDERLQLQEAQKQNISLSNADIDGAIAMVEQQNGMPRGMLLSGLARQGIDPTRVREQIKADMTWLRLVNRMSASQIRIGEEEVNDRLQSIAERQGQREVRAAEIFLPVDNPEQEAESRALGEKLLEGLRAGTPFSALARQFSRAPTSANGGLLGWVSPGMVDDEMSAILERLERGQTSELVRTSAGFVIMTVLETRIVGQSVDPDNSTVTLARMVLPTPPGAPPKGELLERAAKLTRGTPNCAAFDGLAAKAGATTTRIGPTRVGELPADLKRSTAGLRANQVAAPVDSPEGIVVAMVCDFQESLVATPPTAEQVRRQIEEERRDMLSRRYIRNLRRAAFIDVRM